MRPAVKWLIALALVAVAGGVPLAAAGADSVSSQVLIVSTSADAINGDVSSPSALIAHPGSDGISLREAITAADHGSGQQTITFAPSLAGKTITPTSYLPAFTHDGTVLIGPTAANGQPLVTIDGGGHPTNCCGGALAVFASNVTIAHLHVVGMQHDDYGIVVRAGEPGGEEAIHDVQISANVIEDTGVLAVGIGIGTDFPGNGLSRAPKPNTSYPGAMNASLTDVTVADNVINGFTDDGINVALPGTNCAIQNLSIEGNTLSNNTGAGSPTVELDTSFSGNTIAGTQISRNTFSGDWAGVGLNGGVGGFNNGNGTPIPATGNVISGTVISQNTFADNKLGVAFSGGAGAANATGNAVVGTQIVNDLFVRNAPFGAIGLQGGGEGASGNRIDGVQIDNDTIAFNADGLGININSSGSSGNVISNVVAQNTIFWANGRDVTGQDVSSDPPTIRASLTGVDPRFVGAQDFHLQAGSPAIDSGATGGAPKGDLDNALRSGAPDIGAYEFGATARPELDVLVNDVGGRGAVTSSPTGIACGSTCEAAFNAHTVVTLTAVPAARARFSGWSGACSGTGQCQVTLDAAQAVYATFSPATAKPIPKPLPRCKKGQKSTKKHPCRRP